MAGEKWIDAFFGYTQGLKKPVMYLVNAFVDPNPKSVAGPRFSGNPAAVCFAPNELPEREMQSVAMEMNQSETAFIASSTVNGSDCLLRWFTPTTEVDLCGHATLGAAAALLDCLAAAGFDPKGTRFTFGTMRAGNLEVSLADADGNQSLSGGGLHALEMDFPASPVAPVEAPSGLLAALGLESDPKKVVFVGRAVYDYLVEVSDESTLLALAPDFNALAKIETRGVIVTCTHTSGQFNGPGFAVSFLSRAFFPAAGINEDPVTGSAHCALAPYWAKKLGTDRMWAYQASRRGGYVHVTDAGARTMLRGLAYVFMRGELQ